MEHIVLIAFEVVYFLSAVLTAVLFPRAQAEARHNMSYRSSGGYKEQITYGDVFRGILFALIPLVNTIYVLERIAANLDKVKIFKKEGNESH